MNRTGRRFILLILSFSIMISVCGCSEKNTASESGTVSVPEHIIWGIVRYNPYIETINTSSEIMKYLSQKFNCTIEFKYYNSFNTKILKQLLNGDNCPDILTMESMSVEGQFLAANELALPAVTVIDRADYQKIPQKTINLLSEYDNTLYGIPGRYADEEQLYASDFPKNEGVYVCRPFYEKMGKPHINGMDDLITVAESFQKQFHVLKSSITGIKSDNPQDPEPVPIVIGNTGSGLETLKHLFGIYPVFEDRKEVRLGTAAPQWNGLLNWLNRLSRLSVKSMSLSDKALDEILCGCNLFYIGSAPCINRTNFISKSFPYELLQIKDSNKTFSVNPYSSCQTYVIKKSKTEYTKRLISFLFSDNGNFLVKYGIENKHWIAAGDTALPLSWVTNKLKDGDNDFRSAAGIGQLMFLTNLKNDNEAIPDLLSSEKNAFYTILLKFNFSSSESIKLKKLNDLEINLCQRMASTDPLEYPENYSLIMSELSYFPIYEQQYRIESLRDNYAYWKQQGLFDSSF